MRPPSFCPVHGYSRMQCSYTCAEARAELRRLGTALRNYWSQRRKGMRPLPLAFYRARYGS